MKIINKKKKIVAITEIFLLLGLSFAISAVFSSSPVSAACVQPFGAPYWSLDPGGGEYAAGCTQPYVAPAAKQPAAPNTLASTAESVGGGALANKALNGKADTPSASGSGASTPSNTPSTPDAPLTLTAQVPADPAATLNPQSNSYFSADNLQLAPPNYNSVSLSPSGAPLSIASAAPLSPTLTGSGSDSLSDAGVISNLGDTGGIFGLGGGSSLGSATTSGALKVISVGNVAPVSMVGKSISAVPATIQYPGATAEQITYVGPGIYVKGNGPVNPSAPVFYDSKDANGNDVETQLQGYTASSYAGPSAFTLTSKTEIVDQIGNGKAIDGYEGTLAAPVGTIGPPQTVTYIAPGVFTKAADGPLGPDSPTYYTDSSGVAQPMGSTASSFAGNSATVPDWTQHPILGTFKGSANLGFTGTSGQVAGSLVAGLAWAGVAYLGVTLIGSLLGLKGQLLTSLRESITAGALVAGGLNGAVNNGLIKLPGFAPIGIGLVVAAAVFIATYKSQSQQMVTFTCLPYEPQLGGSDCEKCNMDPYRPCTQYRCLSLGQACQLLNAGTSDQQCVWVNPHAVNAPVITTLQEALSPTNLEYTPDNAITPPDNGVKIIDPKDPNGCIAPFTNLTFGITTNEPAQCKLDYTRGNTTTGIYQNQSEFDNMQFYFGGSNYFDYNHTQQMLLPDVNGTNFAPGPVLSNGNTMTLYVECRDANGNTNLDDFEFNFCVKPGPNLSPPVVLGTSINSGGYVNYNVSQVPIEVYTNEPAACRWSRIDQDYSGMENNMSCATDQSQVNSQLSYTCAGNLTGVQNQVANVFYFRCQDYPDAAGGGNNAMQQSYPLTLQGTEPLVILNATPNNLTITGNTQAVPVNLEVDTSDGADSGNATCYYSPSGLNGTYIQMFNTNSYVSTQTLELTGSATGINYVYHEECIDAGGNTALATTNFTVNVDQNPPIVTRAYKEIPDTLVIVTDKNATCGYSLTSCNFNLNDSQQMVHPDNLGDISAAQWTDNSMYYIVCADANGNEPAPNTCSIVVNSVELASNQTSL